jgi:hypothetical protein
MLCHPVFRKTNNLTWIKPLEREHMPLLGFMINFFTAEEFKWVV